MRALLAGSAVFFLVVASARAQPDGDTARKAEAKKLAEDANRKYNLGNGQGFTNLEVVQAAQRVTGRPIAYDIGPRRPGDPAVLIASSDLIRQELGWQPQYITIEQIVATAWEWHSRHPRGYAGA